MAIVQLVRTPGCGPGGRGFKSHWPPHRKSKKLKVRSQSKEVLRGGQMSATWDLKERTKEFSLRIIQITKKLPDTRANTVLSNQILRSATSVGANYRAVRIARSEKVFAAKLQIALEEAVKPNTGLNCLSKSISIE